MTRAVRYYLLLFGICLICPAQFHPIPIYDTLFATNRDNISGHQNNLKMNAKMQQPNLIHLTHQKSITNENFTSRSTLL